MAYIYRLELPIGCTTRWTLPRVEIVKSTNEEARGSGALCKSTRNKAEWFIENSREERTVSGARYLICVLYALTFLQATKKELVELFSAFGELSWVRMPTKTAVGERKQHRGFAFVQMSTVIAARRAFDALVHR